MSLHKLLQRQLHKAGLSADASELSRENLLKFIELINKSYNQADEERYLNDRLMTMITAEINDLNIKLNTVQEIASLGYWNVNVTKNSSSWSRQMCIMLGLKVGMPPPSLTDSLQLIHEMDLPLVQKSIKNAIETGAKYEIEIRIKKIGASEDYKWYFAIGMPFRSSETTDHIIHGIIMDIDKQKRNEAKIEELNKFLIESEKMAAFGQVAAGVSHEINNPLFYSLTNISVIENKIKFLANFINEHLNQIEQVEFSNNQKSILNAIIADLNIMLTEVNDGLLRIKEIVAGMDLFSGISDNKFMALVNINDCLILAVDMVFPAKAHEYHIHLNLVDAALVKGSKTQLITAFVNILVNAKEALSSKGGDVNITTKIKDTMLIITITDNGCGIEHENLSKVFTPFYTTKEIGGGAGLGLASAYGIIQSHHGKIRIESELHKSSTVTIELPLAVQAKLETKG